MDNLQKQLYIAIDECRGSMEVTHLIDLFSHVAFIAKEAPESFQTIVNTGVAKQLKALTKAGRLLEVRHPVDVCAAPDHYQVDPQAINVAIQLFSTVKDFKELGQLLRELSKNTRRSIEVSSNLNMERIFTSLIGNCSNKSLYDGACGLARISSKLNAGELYLEEKNHNTWITAYRLLTLEEKSFKLIAGDSLLQSAFGYKPKFDLVVMEPPFSLRFGSDERRMLAEAPFIKVVTGKMVSANSSDSLWVQQILSNLNNTGKGYVLLPQGFLFRGGYDAKVREYLLENELLESVIGLPATILDGTAIAPVILIFNKNKPAGSPVIFVDASEIGTVNRRSVEISENDAILIAELVSGNIADDPRYKAVFIPEIRMQNNELNISKYIIKNIEIEELDMLDEFAKLNHCQERFDQSQQNITNLLNKFQ